eukprot:961-Heterococcus_DN1.PRE.2
MFYKVTVSHAAKLYVEAGYQSFATLNSTPTAHYCNLQMLTFSLASGVMLQCKKKPPSAAAANSDKLGTSSSGTAANSAAGRK